MENEIFKNSSDHKSYGCFEAAVVWWNFHKFDTSLSERAKPQNRNTKFAQDILMTTSNFILS